MGSAADGPSPSFDDPIATFVEGSRPLAEELDCLTVMFIHLHAQMEKTEHEHHAAVRLQAHHKGDASSNQPSDFNDPSPRITNSLDIATTLVSNITAQTALTIHEGRHSRFLYLIKVPSLLLLEFPLYGARSSNAHFPLRGSRQPHNTGLY
jgi:hypothetical protein